jgi:Caspase domain
MRRRRPRRARIAAAAFLAAFALLALRRPAAAEIERFALLIANNQGDRDEPDLRYAEADADKLRQVLQELGGFREENVVVVRGQGAAAVRRALAVVHQRASVRSVGTQTVLLVYYSGHADAAALHLGGDRLPIDELERGVRDSPATVRLLLVDSCRSGSLTRRKGGQVSTAFSIDIDERLAAQGFIVLTSSSASEDAQESDELRGSFFTHYLASGLVGPADVSGDGAVSLAEAYRYAYDSTLRASSRTVAGPQHASFRYDLSGQGDLVLTRLAGQRGQRAWLRIPGRRSYLLLRGDANGPVVAEVGERDVRRRVSLRPGRYFLRARGRDHLLEGTVALGAGEDRSVSEEALDRVAYARLVRKGGVLDRAHGAEAGVRGRSALDNSERPCLGAFAGYALELPAFSAAARIGWCRAGYDNDTLTSVLDEVDVSLRAGKAWDLPRITLTPFIGVGAGLFHQRFDSIGQAPSRTSGHAHVDAGLSVGGDLTADLYTAIEIAAQTYFFRQRGDDPGAIADFTLALGASLGWHL